MAQSGQPGEEEDNFIRMFKLVTGVGTDAVRYKFDQLFPPATLVTTLKNDEEKLKKLYNERRLNSKQMTILFPPTGTSSSKDFDLILMICLIRNLTSISPPVNGFDKQPSTSETTTGADIARIKFARNKLAHAETNTISSSDFNIQWTDLTNAIVRLGGPQYLTVCNELKSIKLVSDAALQDFNNQLSVLREEFLEELRVLKEIEIEGLKKKLQEVLDEMKEVIPRHIREQFKATIEEWITADKKYVPTAATKHVLEKLKTVNSITVTGNPGMGKTYLTRHVALQMEKQGYTVVPVSKPEDIRDYFEMGRKVVFVIDDICGRFTLNQQYLDSWNQMKDHIKTLLKDKCKIISTCRLQVFQDPKFKELKEIFTMAECNVTTKDLEISEQGKIEISKMYFPKDWKKIVDLVNLFNFFPLLCRLYNKETHGDMIKFFTNPTDVLTRELDELLLKDDEGKLKYCSLALCIMFNNKLTTKMLTEKNSEIQNILEEIFVECELNKFTPVKKIINSLTVLDGVYIVKDNNTYKIIHDKLFDILAKKFGEQMLSVFIKHADSGFIRERFIWRTPDLTDRDLSFTINIPDEEINKYLDRLIKDWTQDKIGYVFHNINIRNSKQFRETFMSHVKNLSPSEQQELANKTNKYGELQDTPLIYSCFIGDVSIIQWLLELHVDVNQCRPNGSSPLFIASEKGHTETLETLINHGADINLCTDNGLSPLYIASQNGHTETLETLINHGADINLCTDNGASPLFIASQNGHTETLETLINHGADINLCKDNGVSPLFKASQNGHTETVKLLLKHDVNINVSSFDGMTPLNMACYKGHLEVVKRLLQEGADVNIRDDDNDSPLDCALGQHHTAIVNILRDHKTTEDIGLPSENTSPPSDNKQSKGHQGQTGQTNLPKKDITTGNNSSLGSASEKCSEPVVDTENIHTVDSPSDSAPDKGETEGNEIIYEREGRN